MKCSFFSIKIMLSALLCMTAVYSVKANNIRIQRIWLSDTNRTAQTVSVNLNLSWEHSWRDSINWDAAWVFFKFREPKDSIWRWRHGNLSKTGNNAGTSTTAMKVVVPDDLKGAFYYRQALGNGNIQANEVKLLWNYGLDGVTKIDSVEIRIFATEMVYVPEGGFCIGNGPFKLQPGRVVGFQLKNASPNYATINQNWSRSINAEFGDSVLIKGIKISGTNGIDLNNDGIADLPDFPIGFRAFYSMKYEVTQGQYSDFLNTLSLTNTNLPNPAKKTINPNHELALSKLDPYFGKSPINEYRHTVQLDTSTSVRYLVSRPDRALGLADVDMIIGFGEWSGLRPMTEFEFEKSCRGPLPPYVYISGSNGDEQPESAWGYDRNISNTGFNPAFAKLSGPENGNEFDLIFDVKKRYTYALFMPSGSFPVEGGDFQDSHPIYGGYLKGPVRAGFFANDTTSRISAGSSFYGIMDLSYNANEIVVSLGSPKSRQFFSYKVHGDGLLRFYINSTLGYTEFLKKEESVSHRAPYYPWIQTGFNGFRNVRTAPSDE